VRELRIHSRAHIIRTSSATNTFPARNHWGNLSRETDHLFEKTLTKYIIKFIYIGL
jgi:hypothetical protein